MNPVRPLLRSGRGGGPNEVGEGEGPARYQEIFPLISPLRAATGPFFSRKREKTSIYRGEREFLLNQRPQPTLITCPVSPPSTLLA